MGTDHIENQGWRISDCCNSKVKGVPPCLGDGWIYICNVCGNICDTTTKPMYLKKAKGIYSLIKYNGD